MSDCSVNVITRASEREARKLKENRDVTPALEGWSVVQGKGHRPEKCRWLPGAKKKKCKKMDSLVELLERTSLAHNLALV